MTKLNIWRLSRRASAALVATGMLVLIAGPASGATSASYIQVSGGYHFEGTLNTSYRSGECEVFRGGSPWGPQLSTVLVFNSSTSKVRLTIALPRYGAYHDFNLATLTKANKGAVKLYAGPLLWEAGIGPTLMNIGSGLVSFSKSDLSGTLTAELINVRRGPAVDVTAHWHCSPERDRQ